MVNIILFSIYGIILFLPAFIANPGAVITGGHFIIDKGKTYHGKRIFGDGKSWSGFIGGSLIGILSGIIIYYIVIALKIPYPDYGKTLIAAIFVLIPMSFGSLAGDITGSFIKRRIGMKRGAKGSILDQWPFVMVSFLMVFIFARGFFMEIYGDLIPVAVILIITPPIHRGVNILAYKFKMKDVPW
ncbi:CDP-2,3-bis-(O-geranylgeranyl)-sn-glycerol synthase [Ferroplasma sp.]|uniref:CDP-2,3-bis-(O-geranylgeranyl)-sn-glycerol synthase n=1 Tax=Ferroplasma sp. TaxID=2591003 RepID=UPI00307D3CBE